MNRTSPLLVTAAAFAACFALLAPAAQAEDPVYQRSGLALGGTDPVAYFTESKPVEGSAEHSLVWNGATWHFASAGNLEKFRAEPEKYAPQYGGYCAWAVSKGYTAKTDPEAWRVVGGKLYLNYDKKIQAKWEEDIPGRIEAADANWPQAIE